MKPLAWVVAFADQPTCNGLMYRAESAARTHAAAFSPARSTVTPLVDGRAAEIFRAAIKLIAETSPMHAKQDPERLVLIAKVALTRAARGEL